MEVPKTNLEKSLCIYYMKYIRSDEQIPIHIINQFKRDVNKIKKLKT